MDTKNSSNPSFTQHTSEPGGWSVLLIPLALFVLWAVASAAFFIAVPRVVPHPTASNSPAAAAAQPGFAVHDLGQPTVVGDITRPSTDLPLPITRTVPTTLHYDLTTQEVVAPLINGSTYHYWTFNGTVPGPMLRVMEGDTVEIHIANSSASSLPHSIDLHAVSGPGGGSNWTQTLPGQDTYFRFKALNPGLFIYHCATPPVADHVVNGMFGMILVEPIGGLPKVDREFYIVQSEIYTKEPFGAKGGLHYDPVAVSEERPTYYVLNGRVNALTGEHALHANVGDRVRIFFGVGTFKPSNFHVIGAIFDSVYGDGGIGGPITKNVGLTSVAAGGTTIAELSFKIPGTYLLVDHSLNRMALGAVGQVIVSGDPVSGVDESGPSQ